MLCAQLGRRISGSCVVSVLVAFFYLLEPASRRTQHDAPHPGSVRFSVHHPGGLHPAPRCLALMTPTAYRLHVIHTLSNRELRLVRVTVWSLPALPSLLNGRRPEAGARFGKASGPGARVAVFPSVRGGRKPARCARAAVRGGRKSARCARAAADRWRLSRRRNLALPASAWQS